MDTYIKQLAIVADLRQRIVSGEYEAEARLPTRTELLDKYPVSPATLQRVFDRLIEDGFVETRGKAGTFVSATAPHLTHYAVLIHRQVTDSLLYRALASEATVRTSGRRRISCYFEIDRHGDSPDYRRLLADLEAQRIAGILFSTAPHEYEETPLMTRPGIPRCALMSAQGHAHVHAVALDVRSFVRRALEFLAARGRRRVAWLLHQRPLDQQVGPLAKWVDDFGLTTRPAWVQYASATVPLGASQMTRLLFDGPRRSRPDALVVADDNLVEPATVALRDAGLSADEVSVIGACNYPHLPVAHFPITPLGFDIGAVVDHCFTTIDLARQGESAPGIVRFPAQFAYEINP